MYEYITMIIIYLCRSCGCSHGYSKNIIYFE